MSLSRITDNIWIGDWTSTLDENILIRVGITHVLCVIPHHHAPTEMKTEFQNLKYKHWHYEEQKEIEIDSPLQFIKEAIEKGGAVLVYCGAGIDRSPTVVMLYLHKACGMEVDDAIKLIRSKRPVAIPHPDQVEKWLVGKTWNAKMNIKKNQSMTTYIMIDGIPREIKASVCTITKRREPLIREMIELLNKQTRLDFEYILVDGYYSQRKDSMLKMFEDLSPQFPIRYVPDKPTRWMGKRPALSSARNTYIIWARGERIIGVDDCVSSMCEDLVERHLYWGQKGYAVSGSWFDKYGWESRHKVTSKSKVVDAGWFYGANHSYDLEDVLKVNGYEELLDGEQGQEDCDLGIRFSRAGVEMLYDPDLWVEFDRDTHTLTQWSPDTLKADLKKEGELREPKRRKLDDGTLHFANEWHTQELLKDKDRTQPLGNHFNLRELRKIPPQYDYDVLKAHEALEVYVDPTPHDWRDGEEIAKIVSKG